MGYTHYWYRPPMLDAEKFRSWSTDCQCLCATIERELSIPLAGPLGSGRPVFGQEIVAFNGEGDDGHETFDMAQVYGPELKQYDDGGKGWLFDFCKTARKPYDLAVTACLIRLAWHFPEGVEIHSDGTASDWEAGRAIVERLLGIGVVPPGVQGLDLRNAMRQVSDYAEGV